MQRIPTYKEILNIAIPLMIGGLSESISSVVDTAFMGYLGTQEIDGMGMATIYLMLITMIGWSLSRSVQIAVSQNYGAEKKENIADVMYNAMIVILPIGIFLFVLLRYYSGGLLELLIQNNDIHHIAVEITQIRAWGLPFMIFGLIVSSFYTGIGDTRPIIYYQGVSAIANIILNYCLVFGHWGCPEMGYEGSAWATVLSQIIGLGVLMLSFVVKKYYVNTYDLFSIRKIKFNVLYELWKLSYPMLALHVFSLGAWAYFFSLIEKMGETELAISIILKQIFVVIALPSFCMANTANTLIGQQVGRRSIDFVIPTIKRVAHLNFGILFLIAVLTYAFRFLIFELFTNSTAVLEGFSSPLMVLLGMFFIMPYANVIFNSIAALGNTKIPFFLEIIVIFFYMIYIYFVIIKYEMGLTMAWSAEIFYWVALLLVTIVYFYIGDWKKRIVFLDKNE